MWTKKKGGSVYLWEKKSGEDKYVLREIGDYIDYESGDAPLFRVDKEEESFCLIQLVPKKEAVDVFEQKSVFSSIERYFHFSGANIVFTHNKFSKKVCSPAIGSNALFKFETKDRDVKYVCVINKTA